MSLVIGRVKFVCSEINANMYLGNLDELTCLGCKRSLVQIQSRRFSNPLGNTTDLVDLRSSNSSLISAYSYHKWSGNIRVARAKFGCFPDLTTRIKARVNSTADPPIVPLSPKISTRARRWDGDMAKRFTDTDKWRKPWFRTLSGRAKMVWIYITDNCDHAGLWPAAYDLMSADLGFEVSRQDLTNWFGEKMVDVGDKIFVPGFIEFQYGALNPANRVHQSAISLLEKEGINKDLVRPIHGAKDKDKDKDKIKNKEGGVGETNEPSEFSTDLTAPFLEQVKPEAQAAWVTTYGDRPWIKTELNKAVSWIHSNSSRAPKSDFARFFNNWLSKAWESYRKSIGPQNQSNQFRRTFEPRQISYPKAEQVEAEQQAQGCEDIRGDPEKAANIRDMIAKAGNMGHRKDTA